MQLIESKSILAKLMATENLTIEQRNVPTAMFDVKNRILTVPVLDNKISGYTYDLFMGHEVGHALYTPMDGLLKARELKIPASISNVIEDVRIEKKIKYKYPGLRSSFNRAYNDLVDKDFFGTKNVDLNELNFIDRVNLFTKGGALQGIRFTPTERELLTEIESTETYNDVLMVCKKVIDYMKEQEELRKANTPEDFEEDEDGEFEGLENHDDFADYEDSDENEDLESDNKKPTSNNDEVDEKVGNDERFDFKDVENDNIRALTDEAYRNNEKKLFAENATSYVYANIPKFDMNEGIMSYKETYSKYKAHTSNHNSYFVEVEKRSLGEFQKLRRETNKVVSYLVKEFELRKNAEQLKRASTAKTGELNMNKIHSYKFAEDIFKKITVMPNGKSHGLVMFLDWSGSMSDHLENTFKQLLSLVLFCKKVNIPYEVYAFATPETQMSNHYQIKPKDGDITTSPFYLLNLLSSRMNATEFNYACSTLTFLSSNPRYMPSWMCLGGTPLNEAIIAAMEIVPAFQKQYKLQIVNTVFLTDGEGHTSKSIYKNDADGKTMKVRDEFDWYTKSNSRGIIFRDPVNRHQETLENIYNNSGHMSAYLKLLKSRSNCNVLGFYVISGREFNRKMYHMFPKTSNFENIKTNFRKNKYAVVTSAGFDEYYILRSEALDTEEDNELVVKENATTRGLVSAFKKYAGGRVTNRVVLNRFIGLIS
jgi:hypothetical protein